MIFKLDLHHLIAHLARVRTPAAKLSSLEKNRALIIRLAWIGLFATLTALGAFIRIPLPFTPVPITLQTLFVLSGGIVIGRDGMYAMILYLILGSVGLPMFAGTSSSALDLLGPTGGYLIGFVAAAAIAGNWLHPKWDRLGYFGRSWRLFLVSLAIFIPGVIQLALFLKIGLGKAFMIGCAPFLIGDILKVVATSAIPSRLLRKA